MDFFICSARAEIKMKKKYRGRHAYNQPAHSTWALMILIVHMQQRKLCSVHLMHLIIKTVYEWISRNIKKHKFFFRSTIAAATSQLQYYLRTVLLCILRYAIAIGIYIPLKETEDRLHHAYRMSKKQKKRIPISQCMATEIRNQKTNPICRSNSSD